MHKYQSEEQITDADRAAWAKVAERERYAGLDDGDGAARWLKSHGTQKTVSPLDSPEWRKLKRTPAQERYLRALGLNPYAYKTRGAASDAIADMKKKTAKKSHKVLTDSLDGGTPSVRKSL